MKNPPNWCNVYPHGTKEGDEELKFFIILTRNPNYQWRSTAAIAKETGLERVRVEEIISKYYKKGMIFQNPSNEDQWGYWERVPQMLPKTQKSISQKDQDNRINKISKDCGKDDGACAKEGDDIQFIHERWQPPTDEDVWYPIRQHQNKDILGEIDKRKVFYIEIKDVQFAKTIETIKGKLLEFPH